VLSPWQCKAVENEYGKMVDLGFSPAPYKEPYILTGSNGGEVTAFFYEPELASGISFGHYLRSADDLYQTLLSIKKNQKAPLIHTATDGEIYGHHEPYGDMALAALINKVNSRDDFIFDNYGSYMAKHPATKHAVLKSGEENRGTSWSCSHGVSRWYKNCGCHTGGEADWNQHWRTGLRNALNNLGNKIDAIFKKTVDDIFHGRLSSEALLSGAGVVFCGKISMKEHLNTLETIYGFSKEDKEKLAHLLTGMKYKHFSFTSCGWFFSELSGIEPRQDIKYAIHAITLFQQFTDDELMIPFLTDLKEAKCNIKEFKDGMFIAQEELQDLPGEVEAVSYFYMNRGVPEKSVWKKTYGKYELTSYEQNDDEVMATVTDTHTDEAYRFRLLAGNSIEKGLSIYLTKHTATGIKPENYHVTTKNIPDRVMDEAYTWLDSAMTNIKDEDLKKEVDQVRYYAYLLKNAPETIDARLVEN
ncbi:MAG: DUF3536 domain-containing protein, partial [Spirochaetales bacterium]|nr:DUF3536 domain-containing protein [Candidatus Physcosoma equi]